MSLQLFNKREKLLKSEHCLSLTIEKAIKSGAHMEVLRKTNFDEILIFMVQLLNELTPYVLNDLTSEKIIDYAESMIVDCPDWKPDDFVLCISNGKKGRYGKSNARWTYQTWNEWADAYDKERREYLFNEATKHRAVVFDNERQSFKNKDNIEKQNIQYLIDQAKKNDR